MKKVKQGHTRWNAVVFEPGKIEGFDDSYVAAVYPCRVSKVAGRTVYYRCGHGGNLHAMPFICGEGFWNRVLYKTYRAAYRAAMAKLDAAIDAAMKGGA